MEKPRVLFDSGSVVPLDPLPPHDPIVVPINTPTSSFMIDGTPALVLTNGLGVGQTFTLQKRVDDLSGAELWTDYAPGTGGAIILSPTKPQVLVTRPGYYRLFPDAINVGDSITATLTIDTTVVSSQMVVQIAGN